MPEAARSKLSCENITSLTSLRSLMEKKNKKTNSKNVKKNIKPLDLSTNSTIILSSEEFEESFAKLQRKLVKISSIMKIPNVDTNYYLKIYSNNFTSYNLHQLSIIIDKLEEHKNNTLQVIQFIMNREKLLVKMKKFIENYHLNNVNTADYLSNTQKKGLELQKSLQKVSTTVVELILKWRKLLTLNYPFRYQSFNNYLLKMKNDVNFVDSSEISSIIFPYRGNPLLSHIPSLFNEKVETLLEKTGKKCPVTGSVTFPMSKSKIAELEKISSTESLLVKYEEIINVEEENEKDIDRVVSELVKKGNFLPVINTGNFDLTVGIPLNDEVYSFNKFTITDDLEFEKIEHTKEGNENLEDFNPIEETPRKDSSKETISQSEPPVVEELQPNLEEASTKNEDKVELYEDNYFDTFDFDDLKTTQ
ncbi:hypothetical protein ABK040_007884 [Willaertia magna]